MSHNCGGHGSSKKCDFNKDDKEKFLITKQENDAKAFGNKLLLIPFLRLKLGSQLEQKSATKSNESREEGNQFFNSSKQYHNGQLHMKVFSLYSKSIAFAPSGSKELTLGYSNRSAVMLHIKNYQYCIKDIDTALSLVPSDLLKAKLLCRKVKCLKLLGDAKANKLMKEARNAVQHLNDESNKEIKQQLLQQLEEYSQLTKEKKLTEFTNINLPNIQWSKEVPCASTAVKLCFDKKNGRHIKATRDIKTGEMLIIEEAYVSYPQAELVHALCSYCFKMAFGSIPCETCSYAMYCSEECKQKAWIKYHSIECLIVPFIWIDTEHRFHGEQYFYVRMFITIMKEGGIEYLKKEISAVKNNKDERSKGFSDQDIFDSSTFRALYSLRGHNDKIKYDPATKFINSEFFWLVIDTIKEYTHLLDNVDEECYPFLEKLMIELTNICQVNGCTAQGLSYCFCGLPAYSLPNFHKKDCLMFRGGFISPFKCFINHSCHPNVSIICGNGKIFVYSNQPIKKDEQLFISYGPDIRDSKASRQEFLNKTFYFKCECEVCQRCWPVYSDGLMDTYRRSVFSDEEVLETALKMGTIMEREKRGFQSDAIKQLGKSIDIVYRKFNRLQAAFVTDEFKKMLNELLEYSYLNEQRMIKEC